VSQNADDTNGFARIDNLMMTYSPNLQELTVEKQDRDDNSPTSALPMADNEEIWYVMNNRLPMDDNKSTTAISRIKSINESSIELDLNSVDEKWRHSFKRRERRSHKVIEMSIPRFAN